MTIFAKVYRMIVSHVFYAFYLLLLILMVWNPFEDGNNWCTLLAGVYNLTLLMDDVMSLCRIRYKRFFKSFWNLFYLTKNLIMGFGLVLQLSSEDVHQRANLTGNDPSNIAGSLVSVALGLEIFLLLRMALLSESLGPVGLDSITALLFVLNWLS